MSETPFEAQRRKVSEMNEKQNAGRVTIKPVALKKTSKKKRAKKTGEGKDKQG